MATRVEHLKEYYQKLSDAKKILLVGGGIVGVELAAEIATHFKNSKVTLAHSKNRLMEKIADGAGESALKFLRKKNVEVIFKEKVIGKKKGIYMTDKGREIEADLVFLCTGIKPNSDFVDSKYLDKRNYISVEDSLQVKGMKNVFCAGDVNSLEIEKTAHNSQLQAKLVAENILAIEKEGRRLTR